MTQLHHLPTTLWAERGGDHTAREIAQQPAVWRQLPACLDNLPSGARATLHALLSDPRALVLLTGAGTSAYAGELVADQLDAVWPAQVRALATTTLLSHPALYLSAKRPLLLVSFARSGNSPESQAAVELVRAQSPGALFLNITCNADGKLARDGAGQQDTINVVLPPASCDQGFAMTSSFTAMVLAALSLLGPDPLPLAAQRLQQLAALAEHWMVTQAADWHALGQRDFQRIIYLGGGPLEALAREAALKVLELSGGRTLALANTPLGFRHGPKSVLNADSLVVLFHSQDAHARRYDEDLLNELRRDQVAGAVLSIDGKALGAPDDITDAWLAVCHVVFAQVLALHQSMRLGLTPDNPFPDGTVNRVVQGVIIHDYA
ncbi:tagatose-6-phosphate ketose/aldose isomerase [Duganella sp. CF402]|uniref:SIS domain-containing protein n=1 Tax=unclassified Duganella TaxID=2636909 RepID=UPI0008D13A15|nr:MULTISPECIES: SIS domain-containing protein [unclassified Duganella]RZT11314.1 tagatose-6-phosphate ketose/aldose isomerase [Duganella sp. BK701]SEK70845.1 tagatose-6-phosphate ketose/aldose isomerase [Duganella sp. CF402]